MSDFTTQFSRISHHTVALSATTLFTGSTFTVPGSELIDDTWSIYDLALSEIGVDEFRDKAYIRIGSNIKEINLGTGGTASNLNQVLTAGNTTGGKDVEVTSGDIIKGQTQGELDFDYAASGLLTLSLDNTLNEAIIIQTNTVNINGSSNASIGVGNALVVVTTTNEDDFRFNTYAFKTIDIGDWNMDTTASVSINHGLSATEWKTIIDLTGWVRNDADTVYYVIGQPVNGALVGICDSSFQGNNSSTITIVRLTGGVFDTAAFDATSYNRGRIRFQYIPD